MFSGYRRWTIRIIEYGLQTEQSEHLQSEQSDLQISMVDVILYLIYPSPPSQAVGLPQACTRHVGIWY
jgi:hypothetical protein